MTPFDFLAATLLVLITPGPTNTVLAASGAAMGLRRAWIMPLAGGLGYLFAVSAFFALAALLAGNQAASAIVRLLAAAWLVDSAFRLWNRPFAEMPSARQDAFWRVFVTTVVNPKAMLIGTVLVPATSVGAPAPWIASSAGLAILAGLAWVLLGALLPKILRPYAYKVAAIVLAGFALLAAVSIFIS